MGKLDTKLIGGVYGQVSIIIDGQVYEMPEAMELTITGEKTTNTYKMLGEGAEQQKANGWKGEATLKFRYGTQIFNRLMMEYINTKKDTPIEILASNTDPNFEGGEIKIRIGNVMFTKVDLFKLGVDTEILDTEVPLTFTEVEYL